MKFSICSYSFHRLLEAGKQDVFRYITDSKELGAAELDIWNAHLAPICGRDEAIKASGDPASAALTAEELAYLDRVKAAAESAGMPVACVAVDGGHIYEETAQARAMNRAVAYRYLDVAERLKARQIRLDAGGTADLPDEMFAIIIEGYHDLIARARAKGIELVMENHWGSSNVPENVVRILEAVDGLGLLFDTNNWAAGTQERGWALCAPYARATHIKTFEFDEAGNEPSVDLPRAINLLCDAGYDGVWGIESTPRDGDEYGGVRKAAALIARVLGE
jgi:sugar phosphate isomerase/epimerase